MLSLAMLVTVMAVLVIATVAQPGLSFAAPFLLVGLDQLGATAHPVFAANSVLMNFFVAGLVAFGVIYRVLRGHISQMRISAVWALVITLYGYAWVTLVWAPPMPDLTGNAAYVPNRLATFLPYFTLYVVLAPLLLQRVSHLRSPLQFLLIMLFLVLVGLVVFGEFHPEKRGLVVAGTDDRTSPLPLASFAGLAILGAILLRTNKFEKVLGILRLAVILLALIAIIGTGTRGQLFMALVVAIVVWPLSREQALPGRYAKGVLGLVVLLFAVWIAFEIAVDVQGYRWKVGSEADVGRTQSTMYGRATAQLEMIGAVLSMWQKNPATILFGVGNSGSFSLLPFHFYPHNVPLEVLAEEGLLGFVLYCSVLVLTYRSFRRLLVRFRGDSVAIGNICFLFSVCFFYFLVTLKDGSLVSMAHYVFFPAIVLANLDLATSKRRSVDLVGLDCVRKAVKEAS